MASSELRDLLHQLAQLCRAHDPTASHVLGCKAKLSDTELSALDRFFGLFLCCTYKSQNTNTAGRKWNGGYHSGQHSKSATSASSGQYLESPAVFEDVAGISEAVEEHTPGGGPSSPASRSRNYQRSTFGANSPNTSPVTPESTPESTQESTPRRTDTEDDGSLGTLTFSPSTKLLLEACKADRGSFLREIEVATTALPTGQGWEAAIATKEDNADLRERVKIFHRFECYNIYKHVVEAGYHTGTHWIRDMRTALSNKLCQEFPRRFPDQKAVNKSLNWVDQGCKYHEWAGQFGSDGAFLGYLIALPLDVPHSTYTSRCTSERMRSTAIELKAMGIDNLVKELELEKLGDHIAATLRDMTGRKRKDIPDVPQGPRKSPRLRTGRSPSNSLFLQPDQSLTLPATSWGDGYNYPGLDMHFSSDPQAFGQSTTFNACRSLAETFTVPYNSPFSLMESNPSPYSGPLQSPDFTAALEPFDELSRNPNYTQDLSQLEPLLAFICNIQGPVRSEQ